MFVCFYQYHGSCVVQGDGCDGSRICQQLPRSSMTDPQVSWTSTIAFHHWKHMRCSTLGSYQREVSGLKISVANSNGFLIFYPHLSLIAAGLRLPTSLSLAKMIGLTQS